MADKTCDDRIRLWATTAPPVVAPSPHSTPARSPAFFRPKRIILAKGALTTPARQTLVERICSAFADVPVEEHLDTPHNKIDLGQADVLSLHRDGKQTLLLGEHRSPLGFSEESGNTCPNYWHFSPYGFCPYGCAYCYLAGTRGIRFSPTVKIFVNIEDMLAAIDRTARRLAKQTAFYLGKLQDGLALDALTGYSRLLVPFFAAHPFARMTLLTKCADVENLLDCEHGGRTTLSWSLNPQSVSDAFEPNTPSIADRIAAMKQCSAAGYPVRAVVMPIIPIPGWQTAYCSLLESLLHDVPLERITFGGICSYPAADALMRSKLGRTNTISAALLRSPRRSQDGRARYAPAQRVEIYRLLIDCVRRIRPQLPIALCLEERPILDALALSASIGRCNCVL